MLSKRKQSEANCLVPFYIKFKSRHKRPAVFEVKTEINFREEGGSGHWGRSGECFWGPGKSPLLGLSGDDTDLFPWLHPHLSAEPSSRVGLICTCFLTDFYYITSTGLPPGLHFLLPRVGRSSSPAGTLALLHQTQSVTWGHIWATFLTGPSLPALNESPCPRRGSTLPGQHLSSWICAPSFIPSNQKSCVPLEAINPNLFWMNTCSWDSRCPWHGTTAPAHSTEATKDKLS